MDDPRPCRDPKEQHAWAATAAGTLRVLEGKWKIVIIVQLLASDEPLRFSELERRIPGVTQKMLIQQLKELEKDGIVIRTLYPQVPPKVEYSLSELGRALTPSFQALVEWSYLKERRLEGCSVA
ncbi:winged helix-turn-helix transcriptional regulator [Tianweitania sp. BSSL-BM11]|uniref:Winged helix-turn-helix transcriptional regulator n=1 Tax=Tianweitania aestuarii TaxID=2814886 RepID=A0ABS5RWV1_9HYPH|nr:helix-turn-helix domain-containing protein [Tianweitania aestuarii]MBS9721489.1 winged helix-turn-helix transcriptional regulator [Tianweitania aestuarii]